MTLDHKNSPVVSEKIKQRHGLPIGPVIILHFPAPETDAPLIFLLIKLNTKVDLKGAAILPINPTIEFIIIINPSIIFIPQILPKKVLLQPIRDLIEILFLLILYRMPLKIIILYPQGLGLGLELGNNCFMSTEKIILCP